MLWLVSYSLLKEDVLTFKQKGKVVLLGDFNVRVGKSSEVDECDRYVWRRDL